MRGDLDLALVRAFLTVVEAGGVTRAAAVLGMSQAAASQQIKRLEEAGDYLCAAAAFMGWHDKIETWNKAKEAKL